MARHFIIKTDGVVTNSNGAGLRQRLLDMRRKRVLGHTVLKAMLRRDAGNQAGGRVRQIVVGGLAVNHQRFTDLI